MSKVIITAVGTSIFSNLKQENPNNKILEFLEKLNYKKKLDTYKYQELYDYFENKKYTHLNLGLDRYLNSESKNIYNLVKEKTKKYSAEINTISKIIDENPSDEYHIKLLSSYSLEGWFCSLVIYNILLNRDFKSAKLSNLKELSEKLPNTSEENENNSEFDKIKSVSIELIDGLMINDEQIFQTKGVDNLINIVRREFAYKNIITELIRLKGKPKDFKNRLEKQWFADQVIEMMGIEKGKDTEETKNQLINKPQSEWPKYKKSLYKYVDCEIIFNITGGYKGVTPLLTTMAQIYQSKLYYTYQDQDSELIELSPAPLSFDWFFLNKYWSIINGNDPVSGETFDIETLKKKGILNKENKLTTLGKVIQAYLKQETPLDNSVVGIYFEHILLEFFYEKTMQGTQSGKPELDSVKQLIRSYKPCYPKPENDIDIFLETSDQKIFIFEAKAITVFCNDPDKVFEQLEKRAELIKEKDITLTKDITLILVIWHTGDEKAVVKAEDIIKNNEVKKNLEKQQKIQMDYCFVCLEYGENSSYSESNQNKVFKISKKKFAYRGIQDILDEHLKK